MKKFIAAVLFVMATVLRAATLGETFTVSDYYHEYTLTGVYQGTGVDDHHVCLRDPDGTYYYGPTGGASGVEGFYETDVTLDKVGTWTVGIYGYHDEPGAYDSFAFEYPLEVTEP